MIKGDEEVAGRASDGFAEVVRRGRIDAGLTQEELAERTGLSVRMIGDLERGRVARPRRSTIELLSRALGLPGPLTRTSPEQGAVLGPQNLAAQQELVTPLVPRQLPAVRQFVGRTSELRQLGEWLDSYAAPIVAISGMAGVGKTALALRWAHQVAGHFPDGQLYLNLRGFDDSGAPMSQDEAVRDALDAFEVPAERIPASVTAQAGLYRSLLADKRALILLDNARDAEQVRPLLPGSPSCLVIVTSRSRLTSLVAKEQAHPLGLDVLTEQEARELLTGRLSARWPAAAEPTDGVEGAVTDLIGLCARLPLALTIVAARAADGSSPSLAALAAQLRSAQGQLDVLDAGDASASARSAFSWSYRGLSDQAARMFRLLGMHPGPDISVCAATSLAGITPDRAYAALTELIRASLLAEHAPGRYACHDLLTAYAAERVRTEDTEQHRREALYRLLDHYMHTARAANVLLYPHRLIIPLPEQQAETTPELIGSPKHATRWWDTEHKVMLAIAHYAAAMGSDTRAWHLLAELSQFLDRRGQWLMCVTTGEMAVAAAVRMDDLAAQAYAHRRIGNARIRLGAYQDARDSYRQALDLYLRLYDRAGQGGARLGIAAGYVAEGRYREALAPCTEALVLFRAAGDRTLQAAALNDIGWCHAQLGDYATALVYGEQAVRMHGELADTHGEARAADSIGLAHHHLGHYADAVDCYQRAVALFQEHDEEYERASTLSRLGDTHQAAGQPTLARDPWQQALSILDALQHPDAEAVRSRLRRL
jgi:tetratricopeptide (TPR) repeat protein/transcriptional regulator with XRE-family HTH domain